jgi:hypothetical protein
MRKAEEESDGGRLWGEKNAVEVFEGEERVERGRKGAEMR